MRLNTAATRFDLSGQTALVTGAARGIGRGIAIGLAQHGANVVLVDRCAPQDAEATQRAVEREGVRCWFMQQDLERIAELEELAAAAWEATGGIDILVNNAGVAYLHHYSQVTWEQWQHVLNVNLSAVFFLTQAIANRLVSGGRAGRIINLSSKNGLVAEAGLAPYNASKGGVELLTQSLAVELGRHGITVNSIAPGIIETEIAGDFELAPGFLDYYREHIPLQGQFGQVEDCVGAAVFLASPAGRYMTGQHLVIDGGVLCEQVPRLQFMKPAP